MPLNDHWCVSALGLKLQYSRMGKSRHEEILGEVNPGFNLWTSAHGFHHLSLTNKKGQFILSLEIEIWHYCCHDNKFQHLLIVLHHSLAGGMGVDSVGSYNWTDCNSNLLFCLRLLDCCLFKGCHWVSRQWW